MMSHRSQIIELIDQGAIPRENIEKALMTTRVVPDSTAWRIFIDNLLLWLGGLSLASSIVFFFAYNWYDMGRFAKFAIIELLIVLTVVAYWKLGSQTVSGKMSLLVSTILLGVLLALYGQTYQTGADTWELFFYWALLMLPWAFVGRFPAIWIVWVSLINLSIIQYYQTFRGAFRMLYSSDTELLWLLFLFNTLAMLAWEYLAKTRAWLAERWAIRLLALGSGISITWLILVAIFVPGGSGNSVLAVLVWLMWVAALALSYRKIWPDLFMLAGVCLSVSVVILSFLARHMIKDWSAGSFLLLAALIIGLGTAASVWLKKVHKEMHV